MRLEKLDILRAVAIILMVIFHLNYSLTYIYNIDILNFSEMFWNIIGKFSAYLFIFIAGISFFLAERKYKDQIYKKYLKYSLYLGIIALLISLSTYIFLPEQYIKFGIIHFFSLSFFLLIFFRKLKYFNIIIAFLILYYGFTFDLKSSSEYLYFLGFTYPGFSSADFYPIIPYFGIILLGYALGLFLEKFNKLSIFKLNNENIFTKAMVFIGRKSLLIYLIHQPVIIGGIWIFVKIL